MRSSSSGGAPSSERPDVGRTGRRAAGLGLLALYAVSGCGALVLETVWLRWFRLLFGATAPAVAATLVAFFAGQALGAALAARGVPRLRRPLLAYGWLEAAVAVSALAVPFWLRAGEGLTSALYDALRDSPGLLSAERLAIALVATLPASFCMGAAFPAIGAAAMTAPRELGARGGALYAANLLGAAAGAALAGFVLPAWIGTGATYGVGIALLATVAVVALGLGRRLPARDLAAAPAEPSKPPAEPRAADGRFLERRTLLALAAFSGFAALAAQVLLVQAFGLVLNQSVHAFAAVLVFILFGLALGAAVVALSERREAVAPEHWVAAGLVATALGLAVFPALLERATDGLRVVSGAGGAHYAVRALGLVALTAGLPVLGAGLVLPALLAVAGRTPDGHGAPAERRLGGLVAANTVGALLGALCGPFVLLAWLGPWSACLLLGFACALAALVVPLRSRDARIARDVSLALGWIAVLTAASPLRVPLVRLEPGEELVSIATSAAGVVAVVARDREILIRTDNHYNLGGSADQVHQERQGHLAALLHPAARHVAWIGSATGISAGALTLGSPASLSLVEIVPDVAVAARLFAAANRDVHSHPSARVVLDDARNFVRATRERFDLVVADLFVPWRAGAGSLYTAEHFAAVRALLLENGVFVQWLPLYQLDEPAFRTILATFLETFPRAALVRGDFFGSYPIAGLVGYAGAVPSSASTSHAAERLRRAGVTDRWVTDPVGLWSLYVGPLAPLAASLAEVATNRDGFPRIEFMAASAYSSVAGGVDRPLTGPRWLAWLERIAAGVAGPADDIQPDLAPEARRAARGGNLLQAAGAAWATARPEQAARYLEAAREALPAGLLDPGAPDPTAAEVWPDE